MSSAFRHIPMVGSEWWLLVMKAIHPTSGEVKYFVDKCMSFGSSISCAIFQAISDAIAWIVKYRNKKANVNYLDDYLFAAALKRLCDQHIQVFLDVCKEINTSVALEKTFWECNLLVFLGLLLDTRKQVICIPMDKLEKVVNWIEFFLNKKKYQRVKEFHMLAHIGCL